MRRNHAGACCSGRLVALAQAALRKYPVPSVERARGANRFRGCDRGMVCDRGRTPALDRLRPPAHGPFGHPLVERRRRRGVALELRGGLSADLSRRASADASHHPQRAIADRRGRCGGRGWPPSGPIRERRRSSSKRSNAMSQVLDLVPIWTLILALAVFFYVLLDGFDLGVGMLFGF